MEREVVAEPSKVICIDSVITEAQKSFAAGEYIRKDGHGDCEAEFRL